MRRLGKGHGTHCFDLRMSNGGACYPRSVPGVRRERKSETQGESPMALIAAALILSATLLWAGVMLASARISDNRPWATDTTIGAMWVGFTGLVIALGVGSAHWL